MGGNALNFETRRVDKKEYFEIYSEVTAKLNSLNFMSFNTGLNPKQLHKVQMDLLPAYEDKNDFGDMDILCADEFFPRENNNRQLLKDVLYRLFEYKEIYCNSNVWSFDYRNFQIDLIFMRMKNYYSALTYYSYNDLGNLMGRVANKMGVKYGHEGLRKKLYSNDRSRPLLEIDLTKDNQRIFDFLGYDYSVWQKGFKKLEDIFEYAVSTKYFTKELFYLENLDHENRTRNRKRKTYMAFLEWLDKKEIQNSGEDFSSEANLDRVIKAFKDAEVQSKIAGVRKEEIITNIAKEKLNGKIIATVTGLKDNELGNFIFCFYKQIERDKLTVIDYAIIHTPEQIERGIKDFAKSYNC